MTEFGLKLRPRAEALKLEDELEVPPDIISELTNFQVDAIRFLWENLSNRKSCIYNDGSHMGKRITLVALISSLIRARMETTRILIACDKEEAIISWIFKLQLFLKSPPCKVYSPGSTSGQDPITIVNISDPDWKGLIVTDNPFTMIVLDIPSTTNQFKFSPVLSSSFVTVIYSADILARPNNSLLDGFLKCFNYSNWYSSVLRRTNEEYLREFPWLDQNRFRYKFLQWKGSRSTQEIVAEPNDPPPSIAVKDSEEEEPLRIMEETQEMSALLFETEDEETPVKQSNRLPLLGAVQSNSLLSSMYLRISQSFANNTPKQRIIESEAIQDSPDLFASILDDSSEEEKEPEVEAANEFNVSTPLSLNNSPLEMVPSQSPIKSDSNGETTKCPVDTTLVNNKSDVFDITTNEVFASKIKVTISQNIQPVAVEDDEEQLKFNTQDILLRTPTKKSSVKRHSLSPSTPSSSGWLSKRGAHKRTPEKLLTKKRRSLVQFYNSSGESRNGNGSLDMSSLDDEETLRWNACCTPAEESRG